MKLKVGDKIQQAWKGCRKPLSFEVLSIDREHNSLRVKVFNTDGYTFEEEWDDLDVTENAFDIGEYKIIE